MPKKHIVVEHKVWYKIGMVFIISYVPYLARSVQLFPNTEFYSPFGAEDPPKTQTQWKKILFRLEFLLKRPNFKLLYVP